jgi:hypothetical protein
MKQRKLFILLAIFAAVLMNNGLQLLQEQVLEWPFYFDSVFTITIGIFFGWLPGVITGLLTNLLIEVIDGFQGLTWPFAIVNMATGLIAGLLAADKKRYWTLPGQVTMILALTAANTLLGAFIVNVVYGGLTGTAPDILVSALLLMGRGKALSTILARVPINLVDKGTPVLIIYMIHRLANYRNKRNRDPLRGGEY